MQGITGTTHRKWKFVVGIVLFCCFGGIMYAGYAGCKVNNIEFIGEGMQLELNQQKINSNIFFFPSANIRKELLHEYSQLKDVRIAKRFPHTIVIEPMLRTPAVILHTQAASYSLDEEGYVIGVGVDNMSLPELFIDVPTVAVGRKLDHDGVRQSLVILQEAKSFFPIFVIRTSSDGSALIAKSGTTEILFTQNQDIKMLISTLQTIVLGVRIKGAMPNTIDMRFTKPVITW